MRRKMFCISVILVFTLGFALAAFANVPPPPVNQLEGIDDGIFNNLNETDCRFCHEGTNPNVNVEGRCSETGTVCFVDDDCTGGTDVCVPVGIPDRHHLLALTPESIPNPESLLFNGQCSVTTTTICSIDADCPLGETCNNDPLPNPPVSPTDADINGDGVRDSIYGCNNCHPDNPATPVIDFTVTRDCLQCHVQIGGQGSVHHIAATSPAQENRCFVCHGDLVNLAPGYCSDGGGITQPNGERNTCTTDADCPGANNTCGDGHIIPTYEPSLVTPKPSRGLGPANPISAIVFRGSCEYCHSTGNGTCRNTGGFCLTDADCTGGPDICIPDPVNPGTDTSRGALDPVEVYGNPITHHNTGLGLAGSFQCLWCHPGINGPNFDARDIRTCENCHGLSSLHNIQVDSDATGLVDTDGDGVPDTENLGNIINGAENPWYGHIGMNMDCLGCHGGYEPAAAPGEGPVVPSIDTADATFMIAGTDKAVTLTGSSFENILGSYLFTSNVTLTASDGSSTTLTPDAISESSLTVTIPGSTAVGNYDIRVAKDDGTGTGGTVSSNPVVMSVIPNVTITSVDCNKKKGMLTVTGTGFGEKPEGTDGDLNLQVNGQTIELISWSDTQIRASVDRCSKRAPVTVNALFGSATNGKPCKGKKCR